MPGGKAYYFILANAAYAKITNTRALGSTSLGWLILVPFAIPETQKGGRCTAFRRMQGINNY